MKLTTVRASALAAVVAAVASFAAACTSSGSGSGTGTGTGATAADFCADFQAYVSKCNVTDLCTTQTAQNCDKFASALSSAAISSYTSCYANASCGDAGTVSAAACFTKASASVTPTAAQEKLATDYCAVCATSPQTPAQCSASFYVATDGGTNVGPAFIDLNDSLVTQVDTQCVSKIAADAGAVGCFETLVGCALPIIQSAVYEPPACTATTSGGNPSDGG